MAGWWCLVLFTEPGGENFDGIENRRRGLLTLNAAWLPDRATRQRTPRPHT
jgi:hypothetical protein